MNILVITDFVMAAVDDERQRAIEALAGPDPMVTIADSREQVLAAAPEADVILGSVDEEVFAAATKLKWIQATAAGVDMMLFPELRNSKVLLSCEKGLVGSHLADHAMALLLALVRELATAVREGPAAWNSRLDYRLRELELEGLAMGIVGFGGTGRAIAKRAAAFGMTVRALDLFPMAGTAEVAEVEPLDNLDDLLAASDVVALGAPLTDETNGMFDAGRFAHMKPGALLINVTRGELVDHDALVAALESGRLGGAGLDVTPVEPLPADDPLWRFPNVVMTPHTAGASQHRAGRTLDRFIENLGRFRRGEPLLGAVDKALGF